MIPEWPATSVFGSLEEASAFFAAGSLGYSATARPDAFDGLELRTLSWRVQPLEVVRVKSSFFRNPKIFPAGSAQFDCALLMHGVEHEWHGRPLLYVAGGQVLRPPEPAVGGMSLPDDRRSPRREAC